MAAMLDKDNIPRVECGITTCKYNNQFSHKYGYCECSKDIVLKFRAYLELEKGGVVYLECLNQKLPQDKEK